MSRLLFCVDHLFQRTPDGIIYTTGGRFPYDKWLEYLDFFDELTVVARTTDVAADKVGNLARSSGPKVRHLLLGSARGMRRVTGIPRQHALIAGAVAEADAVIGRLPSEIGLTACRLAARAGKPYLVELVGCPWDALWGRGSLASKLYAPLSRARTRATLAPAPLVHYVTRGFLQGRYPTSGAYVCATNAMLPEPEPDAIERRIARFRSVRAGGEPLVFGTIGSMMTRLKGVFTAITALAEARDRLPPFVYRVLGESDNGETAALAAKLGMADRVVFDGLLPGAREVAGWLDGVDVYLQPSFQEGLPRGMIEAMNRACLAIGSTAGGIPELVPAERLHRPGDAKGLRQRIEALVATPDMALETEMRHNFEVAQSYSYPRMLAEKRRAYRALADWPAKGSPPMLAEA
jgi:glycosyltransferase involved in cell wall biosynthesis